MGKSNVETNIDTLKKQISTVLAANNDAIRRRFSKLRDYEIEKLTDEVSEYTNSVSLRLLEIENSGEVVLEKLEKTEDLKIEITRRKNNEQWFHRDIGPIEKTIMISNYYSAPLIDKLCLLCDIYVTKFKKEYNSKNNEQKYNEINQHVALIPITFMKKTNSRYSNAIKWIDELALGSKNKKLERQLKQLKQTISRAKSVRTAMLWMSIVPGLCLFVFLTYMWGEQYGKNILVPLASIALSIILYVIIFNTIMGIYKIVIFRDK